MYTCPHCRRPGVSYVSKWCSCSFGPAKCAQCGQLSYVPATVANMVFCLCLLFLILTGILAYRSASWNLLGAGIVIMIIGYWSAWHFLGLRATTPEQAAAARKLSWGGLVAALMINFFN